MKNHIIFSAVLKGTLKLPTHTIHGRQEKNVLCTYYYFQDLCEAQQIQ